MIAFKAKVAPIMGSYANSTFISFEQGTVVVSSSKGTEEERNAAVQLKIALVQAEEQRDAISIKSSKKFKDVFKEYTADVERISSEVEYYEEYKEARIAASMKLQNTLQKNKEEEELAQAEINANIKPEREAVRNTEIKNILLQTGITEVEAKAKQEHYSERIKEIQLNNAAKLEMILIEINIVSEKRILDIKENAELISELEEMLEEESTYSSEENEETYPFYEIEMNVIKVTYETAMEKVHARYGMMEKDVNAIEEIYKELNIEVEKTHSPLLRWGVTTDAQNGTEWSDISDTEADIFFNTEDNPPIKWFQQISAKYPEIELALEYSIPEEMTVENEIILDSGTPFIDNDLYQSIPDLFRSLFENKKESFKLSSTDGLAGSFFVSLIISCGIFFLLSLPNL